MKFQPIKNKVFHVAYVQFSYKENAASYSQQHTGDHHCICFLKILTLYGYCGLVISLLYQIPGIICCSFNLMLLGAVLLDQWAIAVNKSNCALFEKYFTQNLSLQVSLQSTLVYFKCQFRCDQNLEPCHLAEKEKEMKLKSCLSIIQNSFMDH